jgi:hypothetical protein
MERLFDWRIRDRNIISILFRRLEVLSRHRCLRTISFARLLPPAPDQLRKQYYRGAPSDRIYVGRIVPSENRIRLLLYAPEEALERVGRFLAGCDGENNLNYHRTDEKTFMYGEVYVEAVGNDSLRAAPSFLHIQSDDDFA